MDMTTVFARMDIVLKLDRLDTLVRILEEWAEDHHMIMYSSQAALESLYGILVDVSMCSEFWDDWLSSSLRCTTDDVVRVCHDLDCLEYRVALMREYVSEVRAFGDLVGF